MTLTSCRVLCEWHFEKYSWFQIILIFLSQGYREAIISRETAMFMTTSKLATEFHSWLQDGAMSEEFFFATMARVIQKEYRETGNVVQGKKNCIV